MVGKANAEAATFVKAWPNWYVPVVAIYGPSGVGKSHLAWVWHEISGATLLSTGSLSAPELPMGPSILEDCDSLCEYERSARGLFHLLERANLPAPVLLTGRTRPSEWRHALPDLASRFSAMPAFALRMPDDEMLAAIVDSLFAERQLTVPQAVVHRILKVVERTPTAVRAFVEELDRAALAKSRSVSLGLVGEILARREQTLP